ncbi:hypothetical protein PA10_00044 [Pseudomonas phage pPa_SNUABM_DT01]|nr:hypothetical protein PA10_00044 [Pseudomonas phage pPa_SNUABM_DT01]
MLKNVLGVAAVAGVAFVGYKAIRHFKKDSPAELQVSAKEAVDNALKGVREDLAKPAPAKSDLHQTFEAYYATIATSIGFEQSWKNGTDYLNGAIKNVKLEDGKLAKSIDDHGRRIILIGTQHGTIVLFERFSPQVPNQPFVVVHNEPRELINDIPRSNLTMEQFVSVVGTFAKR